MEAWAGLLDPHTIDTWGWVFFPGGTILRMVGCLVMFLVSTHSMTVALSMCINVDNM